jgi:hypothetical protein
VAQGLSASCPTAASSSTKDAERYQEYCQDLGYEKFSDEEMEEMRRAYDDVVTRCGLNADATGVG